MDEYIPYLQQWQTETPRQRLDRLIPDQMSWDITNPRYAYTPQGTVSLADYLSATSPQPMQGEATPTGGPIEEAIYWGTPAGALVRGGKLASKGAGAARSLGQRGALDIFRQPPKPTGPTHAAMKKAVDSFITGMEAPQYAGLAAKETLGEDLVKEIVAKGYSPEVRAKILDRYAFSAQRKELVETVKPHIEKVRELAGPRSRGYMYGSMTSEKPVLGDVATGKKPDVDLLVYLRHPELRSTTELEEAANVAHKQGLHSMLVGNFGKTKSPATGKYFPSWAAAMFKGAKKKYPLSEPVRLWGTAPIALGLEEYLKEE